MIQESNVRIPPVILVLMLALVSFAAGRPTFAASSTFRQLAEELNANGQSFQLDSLVEAQRFSAYKLAQDALERGFDGEDKGELLLAERLAIAIERRFDDAFYLRQIAKFRAWQGPARETRRLLKQRFGDVVNRSERAAPDTLCREFEKLAQEFLRFGDSATAVKAWQHAGLIQAQTGAEAQGQRLLQTALVVARSIGDLDATARSYNLIGGFFQRSGYYLKAGAYFDSARVIRATLRDDRGLADCLSNIGGAYLALGNRGEAFRFAAEALRLRREMIDFAQICQSLLNMITAFHHDRPDSEVIAWLQEARLQSTPIADGQLQARLLQAEGLIAEDGGDLDTAAALYESALQLAEVHNNPSLMISLLLNLASLKSSQGDYRGALEYYLKAEHRATVGGSNAALATVEHDLGVAFQKLGDIETAAKHYQRSLEIRRQLRLPNDMVETLTNLSDIYLTANDSATASGYLRQASEIAGSYENPRLYAGSLAAQAMLARHAGEFDIALAQLDSAKSIYEQVGDRQGVFDMLMIAADYARLARDFERSAKHVATAAPIRRWRDTYANQQRLDLVTGLLHFDRGELDSAYFYLARVVDGLERTRRNIPDIELRAFQKSSNRFVYEKLVAIFENKYQQGQVDCLDSLLRYVELAKSRSLLDAIGQSRGNVRAKVPREMMRQEQSLLSRIERAESQLVEDVTPSRRESLIRKLADLNVDLANARLRQSLEDPRADELYQPQPLSLTKLRERLPDERTAILDYLLMPEQSLLMVVTKTETRVCPLASRPDLTNALADYLALLQRSIRDESLIDSLNIYATDLAHSVFGEFSASVSKFERLHILPDGALALLPFESLICGGKYLIERTEVAYLPSLQFLTAESRTASRERPRLLVFADPEPPANLQPLPYSLKEAQWLSSSFPPDRCKILTGKDAAKSFLLSPEARSYDYIHFATHSSINPDDPLRSRIWLASDSAEFLSLSDVMQLSLSADLAVLSSCESGGGRFQLGEGIEGFVRGFMYAGCHNVIVSLWDVEDFATAILMREFYQNLTRGYAAALRQAKLAMIDSPRRRHRHPYYWATFVLVEGS